MDENSAWRAFCQTGRIEDYMNYTKVKTGGSGWTAGFMPNPVNVREPDADKNRGTYH